MIDQRLRRSKEAVTRPLAVWLAPWTPPVGLTLAGFAATVAAAAAAWVGVTPVAVAAWLVGRALDGLDGAVARAGGAATDLGGYLDMVLDTIGYGLVPLALAARLATTEAWVVVAVLLATFYVNAVSWTYLSALLEKRSAGAARTGELTSIAMPPALVEGTETLVLFTLALLVPRYVPQIFGLMAAGVAVSAVQRVVWARTHL